MKRQLITKSVIRIDEGMVARTDTGRIFLRELGEKNWQEISIFEEEPERMPHDEHWLE